MFAAVNGNVIHIYSVTSFENILNLKGHNGKVSQAGENIIHHVETCLGFHHTACVPLAGRCPKSERGVIFVSWAPVTMPLQNAKVY